MRRLSSAMWCLLLVGSLLVAAMPPRTALADARGPGGELGRAWLPGEEALRAALLAGTRGRITPFLWPVTLPPALVSARSLAPPQPPTAPGSAGSFLVDYRSADGATFLRFGVERGVALPAGTRQAPSEVRDGLPATLVVASGAAAGEVWMRWSEPGRWQPGGGAAAPLPAVDYLVWARGLTKDEVVGVAFGMVAAEGPWAYVRGRLPAEVLVLRPTWLPAGFTPAPIPATAGNLDGPAYCVAYIAGAARSIRFCLGPVNGAPPDTTEPVRVRGIAGILTTSAQWTPRIGVFWKEGGGDYSVLGNGVTPAELLRSVDGLTAVGPTTGVTRAPDAGDGGLAGSGGPAVALLLTLAAGFMLVGRVGKPHAPGHSRTLSA